MIRFGSIISLNCSLVFYPPVLCKWFVGYLVTFAHLLIFFFIFPREAQNSSVHETSLNKSLRAVLPNSLNVRLNLFRSYSITFLFPYNVTLKPLYVLNIFQLSIYCTLNSKRIMVLPVTLCQSTRDLPKQCCQRSSLRYELRRLLFSVIKNEIFITLSSLSTFSFKN